MKDKDLIATFNWDPFLLQAYRRNISIGNLPQLSFLHGNIFLGKCEEDRTLGYIDCNCSKCNKRFKPVDLLFPVTHKNYNNDEVIKSQWDMLTNYLDTAYFLTIFGYSAPKSDIEAISIMEKAWKNNGSVGLAEIEIIDIKESKVVLESWNKFIIKQHYLIIDSIKQSWLWQFPRESAEALFDATLQNDPIEPFKFPETKKLSTLQDFARNIKIRNLQI